MKINKRLFTKIKEDIKNGELDIVKINFRKYIMISIIYILMQNGTIK